MNLLLLIIGLVLLFLGAEALVRGAVALARRWRVSPALVGLTVVAIGTSAPELVVTVQAALRGNPDVAAGNIIGSNIANILLVLGIGAVLAPIASTLRALSMDMVVLMVTTAVLFIAALSGGISTPLGAVFLILLAVFIAYAYHRDRTSPDNVHAKEAAEFEAAYGLPLAGLLVLGGLAGLVLGAGALITGALGLARAAGIPEAVIALTLVAVGTSLPELFTTAVAARRGHGDVAIANVIGSNIVNILAGLGLAAVLAPLPINEDLARRDGLVMTAITAGLMAVLAFNYRLDRRLGGLLLLLYGAYAFSLYLSP